MPGCRGGRHPGRPVLEWLAARGDFSDLSVTGVEEGRVVLCDRYVESSLAYQGVDVDLRFARQINDKAIAPDLTFFLKVRADVAIVGDRIATIGDLQGMDADTRIDASDRIAGNSSAPSWNSLSAPGTSLSRRHA